MTQHPEEPQERVFCNEVVLIDGERCLCEKPAGHGGMHLASPDNAGGRPCVSWAALRGTVSGEENGYAELPDQNQEADRGHPARQIGGSSDCPAEASAGSTEPIRHPTPAAGEALALRVDMIADGLAQHYTANEPPLTIPELRTIARALRAPQRASEEQMAAEREIGEEAGAEIFDGGGPMLASNHYAMIGRRAGLLRALAILRKHRAAAPGETRIEGWAWRGEGDEYAFDTTVRPGDMQPDVRASLIIHAAPKDGEG